jgi:hypothetical protein
VKDISIDWWSSAWESKDRDDQTRTYDAAIELAETLKTLPKLEHFKVRIPYGYGLGKSRLKPQHFATHYQLTSLRSITSIWNLQIETPNKELTEWLLRGMSDTPEAQQPTVQRLGYYYQARNHSELEEV